MFSCSEDIGFQVEGGPNQGWLDTPSSSWHISSFSPPFVPLRILQHCWSQLTSSWSAQGIGAMEPSKEGRKKFTVKIQDDEAVQVKPLFKPSSVSRDLATTESTNVRGGKSYADYIVGQQAGSSSVAQVKQGTVGIPAAKPTTSAKPPSCEKRNIISKATEETTSSNPMLKPGTKHSSIIVSPRQRGNPVLKFIHNVPWEFGEIVPDYLLGQSTCALFLSLRYHNLNPNYIHERLRNLGKTYALQVLLLQVDVKDPHQALKDLAKICILSSCTLILAWSPEEAGRYLETYKAYEQKPADLLKEKVDKDYLSRMTDCLTGVKSVNKTDTLSLLSNFKSLANVVQASKEDLSLCPGIGPQKARRLFDALHEPFLKFPKRTEASHEQESKE